MSLSYSNWLQLVILLKQAKEILNQMQDGRQDLVDRLNLLCSESNYLHGISDSFKISTVIYRGLQD